MTTTYKTYRINATYTGSKASPWSASNHNHHRITVTDTESQKRTSFDFWASIAHPVLDSEYDLLNAFYCFISDATSGALSFADFCSEFGYDEDSRKAERTWRACKRALGKLERTWRACKRALGKLERISGIDEDGLYELVNDLQEVAG